MTAASGHSAARDRLPPHLREFVVEQDYAAYDEIDQAVWRFILLQTHARLSRTAHPAYASGLRQTGISVERIPRIEEMDARLADYGWGAVAVDGFIPPRAFQQFQALGIMTIAADIRSAEHLAYTPAPGAPSETALLSRLHWWTVEYGLVGTPERYFLYGAGLLSSLGESHFCHRPDVAKLPLDGSCVEVGYDITRPQPQLFVARDFEHLQAVLDEVAAGLAQRVGGARALERAVASREIGTVELSSGVQVTGVLARTWGESARGGYLLMTGACALAIGGRTLPGHGRSAHPDGYGTPFGRLEDGAALSGLAEADLERYRCAGRVASHRLRFQSGIRMEGRLRRVTTRPDGRLLLLHFESCRVTRGDEMLFDPAWGTYDLAVGEAVVAAFAGPADPVFWERTAAPSGRVPRRAPRRGEDARMLVLYREALALWEHPEASGLVSRIGALADRLRDDFPADWLLRWNLLECLRKVNSDGDLATRLRVELLEIESHRPRDLPISMGLGTLEERHSA